MGVVVEVVNATTFHAKEMNARAADFGRYTIEKNRTVAENIHFIYKPGTEPGATPPRSAYFGHIVQWAGDDKAQKTAWLVDAEGNRRWIKDAATYWCLKNQGVPGPVALPSAVLDQYPDLYRVDAQCAAPAAPPAPPVQQVPTQPKSPPAISPPVQQPPPNPAPTPTVRGFTVEDTYLGGTWARTDPNSGGWYSKGNRPANGAYWYPTGLGVGVDCARAAASYTVKISGRTETWNTWFHVTDGKWYPSAASRGVNSNGFQGLPGC